MGKIYFVSPRAIHILKYMYLVDIFPPKNLLPWGLPVLTVAKGILQDTKD